MIIDTKKEKKKSELANHGTNHAIFFFFFFYFFRNKSCNFISRKFSVLKGTFRFI